jgi:hypothetical protein
LSTTFFTAENKTRLAAKMAHFPATTLPQLEASARAVRGCFRPCKLTGIPAVDATTTAQQQQQVLEDVDALEQGAAPDVRATAPGEPLGMLFFTSDFSDNGVLVVKRHGPDAHLST